MASTDADKVGPQTDHPDVAAARIAHGVDEPQPDKPETKKSAKS